MSVAVRRILLADDNKHVRDLVSEMLRTDPRYELMEAENGTEALELAANGFPDLILLDVLMPGIDGIDACKSLKANPRMKGIPVVMLTVMAQEADRKACMDAGADGFLTKPFSVAELHAYVDKLLLSGLPR